MKLLIIHWNIWSTLSLSLEITKAYFIRPFSGRVSEFNFLFPVLALEEVILNEDRTTEEERRYIMEARKRAMQKRKKLRTLGKSRSTESEDEENEEEEGKVSIYWQQMALSVIPLVGISIECCNCKVTFGHFPPV